MKLKGINTSMLGVEIILLVIGFVIALNVYLSQAPTVHQLTDTSAGKALENVSTLAKTTYGYSDVLFSIGVLLLIISIALGVYKKYGKD